MHRLGNTLKDILGGLGSAEGCEGAGCTQSYTLVAGDTLTDVAARFGSTVDAILAANPSIEDPDMVAEGDVITITASKGEWSPHLPVCCCCCGQLVLRAVHKTDALVTSGGW
jgi:LysM repeat protein